MILRLLALIPKRQWNNLQTTFTPEGRISVANWLLCEREQLSNFVLNYETPELRRISKKESLGKASEEELSLLKMNKKVFTGHLLNGEQIRNPKSIAIINKNINYVKTYSDMIDTLLAETTNNSVVDTLILGERLTNINLSPRKFISIAYSNMFELPQWVLEGIQTLLELKMTNSTQSLFPNSDAFISLLSANGILDNDNREYVEDLCKVTVSDAINIEHIQQAIITILSSAKKLDNEFDIEIYEDIHPWFPQYHGVNVNWTLNFLSSYIGSYKPYVSPSIDLEMLAVLYRKAVELTC